MLLISQTILAAWQTHGVCVRHLSSFGTHIGRFLRIIAFFFEHPVVDVANTKITDCQYWFACPRFRA